MNEVLVVAGLLTEHLWALQESVKSTGAFANKVFLFLFAVPCQMGRPQLKQVGAFWLPDFPPGGCIPVKVLNMSSTTLSPPRTLALQKINALFFRVTGSGVPSPFHT